MLQFGLVAEGADGGDVPGLLDRVADAIRGLGAVDVVDVVFRPAQDGTAAAVSVYFTRAD